MNTAPTSRDRTARYRQTLREKGLRPVQLWLRTRARRNSPREARRQCARINAADRAEGLMDWVEQVSVFDEDDAR